MAFEQTLLISVKNVDLPTALKVSDYILKRFNYQPILIRVSLRKPAKEGVSKGGVLHN
jgi:hypothetical protein